MSHEPAQDPAAAAESPPRLAAALARLDQIVRRLDSGEMELEDQMALYVEGCNHVVAARRIIQEAILRIDEMVETVQGGLDTQPLAPGG
jgi:exodeoxyribonuclease VII small subunit